MTELRHTVTKPDLYERLIDRLGLALEMARTAVRLRNENPAELELRGLSYAEVQLIEAYLDRNEVAAGDAAIAWNESADRSRELAEPAPVSRPLAKVIWLKDQKRACVSLKLSRYSSTQHFKR
ncbi:hypothetical protein [Pseudomonas huanghezhanensis]|uniref:hypothetical protein n=1 Tax=Pseudomonas huanghezhanensis TaxID=3002903 RepID=UPI002285C730|nr:hypothetical protein [Pseudomonas sp. BSw22131]